MTTTYTDFVSTNDQWQDLVVTIAALSGVQAMIQNKSANEMLVFFGGGSAPASLEDGTVLKKHESITGTATNIWVRPLEGGKCRLSAVATA